jgi:amino acid permease
MTKLAMIFLSGLMMAAISYLILYLYWRHRNRRDKFDELMDKYGYPVGKIGLMVFVLLYFLLMQYFDLL